MINSFLKNLSITIKDKLTKKEFNPNLIDLKVIRLTESIDLERSKLNPFSKGLILNEGKGQFEQINLNSDSNYNKLQTSKENAEILKPIINYSNNNSSWYDYLKNIIFGGRNPSNSSFFSKFFKRSINFEQNIESNFSFNSDGKFIGFINQEGNIILSNIELNEFSYVINSNISSNEGISSFAWDSINSNKLFYSSNNILYECSKDESKDELNKNLYINKIYLLSRFSKFINCFPSPKGDLLILLYEKCIEVYDIYQNLLFSKMFITHNFINALYDYKSSVFIVYEENNLMIFNIETFDFKQYSYFPGSIIKVINNPENDNIYIFVIDKSKQNSELFMFTLSDISIASDVNLDYDSYQNCENFYRHCHYILRPEIYAFQHNLMICNTKILNVDISPNDYRIGILFQEIFPNNIIQNSLYIFALTKDKRDNSINKVYPLYNFGHVEGSQILSFEFNKMSAKGNTFLVVRFENDIFVKTEKING